MAKDKEDGSEGKETEKGEGGSSKEDSSSNWNCAKCTYLNEGVALVCSMCGTPAATPEDKEGMESPRQQAGGKQAESPATDPTTATDGNKRGWWIEVFWPHDNQWYAAQVVDQQGTTTIFVVYDDGDDEWLELSEHKIRWLSDGSGRAEDLPEDNSKKQGKGKARADGKGKRRANAASSKGKATSSKSSTSKGARRVTTTQSEKQDQQKDGQKTAVSADETPRRRSGRTRTKNGTSNGTDNITAITEAMDDMEKAVVTSTSGKSKKAVKKTAKKTDTVSKGKQWPCQQCSFLNKMSRKTCEMCGWNRTGKGNKAVRSTDDQAMEDLRDTVELDDTSEHGNATDSGSDYNDDEDGNMGKADKSSRKTAKARASARQPKRRKKDAAERAVSENLNDKDGRGTHESGERKKKGAPNQSANCSDAGSQHAKKRPKRSDGRSKKAQQADDDVSKIEIGTVLLVEWAPSGKYYEATVVGHQSKAGYPHGQHQVQYSEGSTEWLLLQQQPGKKSSKKSVEGIDRRGWKWKDSEGSAAAAQGEPIAKAKPVAHAEMSSENLSTWLCMVAPDVKPAIPPDVAQDYQDRLLKNGFDGVTLSLLGVKEIVDTLKSIGFSAIHAVRIAQKWEEDVKKGATTAERSTADTAGDGSGTSETDGNAKKKESERVIDDGAAERENDSQTDLRNEDRSEKEHRLFGSSESDDDEDDTPKEQAGNEEEKEAQDKQTQKDLKRRNEKKQKERREQEKQEIQDQLKEQANARTSSGAKPPRKISSDSMAHWIAQGEHVSGLHDEFGDWKQQLEFIAEQDAVGLQGALEGMRGLDNKSDGLKFFIRYTEHCLAVQLGNGTDETQAAEDEDKGGVEKSGADENRTENKMDKEADPGRRQDDNDNDDNDDDDDDDDVLVVDMSQQVQNTADRQKTQGSQNDSSVGTDTEPKDATESQKQPERDQMDGGGFFTAEEEEASQRAEELQEDAAASSSGTSGAGDGPLTADASPAPPQQAAGEPIEEMTVQWWVKEGLERGLEAVFNNWRENVEFMFAQPPDSLHTALASLRQDLDAQEQEVAKLTEVQNWWKSEEAESGGGLGNLDDDDAAEGDDGGLADAKQKVEAYKVCERLMARLIEPPK